MRQTIRGSSRRRGLWLAISCPVRPAPVSRTRAPSPPGSSRPARRQAPRANWPPSEPESMRSRVERATVGVIRHISDAWPRQLLIRESGGTCRERIAQSAVDQKRFHGIGERFPISWRDDQSGLAVDHDLRHVANAGCNNRPRKSECHGAHPALGRVGVG